MPFGMLDTRYIDFPPNVDVRYLQGLRTRAGVDFPRVLREIDGRLGAFNAALDSLVAALIAATTEVYADAIAPVAFEVNERGEYTLARPQLVEGAAHMLPLRGYDVTLGFTEDGLEAMSLPRIIVNIESLLLGLRREHRRQVFRRLFSDAEVRVDAKTTVTSPGFAGSGTGDNVFGRPYPNGVALPGGYTHYLAADTGVAGALRGALQTALARLKRWGPGPYDLIAPQAKIDQIAALGTPDYVPSGSALVRVGSGQAEALVDADTYLGVLFGEIRVRKAIDDTAAPVIAVFKSGGALAADNPLAWRYDELKGRNAILRYRSFYPLADATVKQDFGIGVNNRVGAVLIRADAGAAAYVAPTDL